MPQGAHPSVDQFMVLHSVLFPIRPIATLTAEKIHKVKRKLYFCYQVASVTQARHMVWCDGWQVGIVDASTRDRLGPGVSLLDRADEVSGRGSPQRKINPLMYLKRIVKR